MKPSRSATQTAVFSFALSGLLVCGAYAQKPSDWKGRFEKEGDVVVVKNPNKPLYGASAFSLTEELAIGGEEGADYVFASIDSIAVGGDGTIFVLDEKDKKVKIFDQNGKFLKAFGRAGQGPGEFSSPSSIHWTNKDELLVANARGRMSFFKASGEHIRDLSPAIAVVMDVRPDSRGDHFVYHYSLEETNPSYKLSKVDAGFKTLFQIESSPLPNTARDGFEPFFPVLRWAVLPDDKVVCGYAVKYEFRIYDPVGKLVRKIQMNPDPVPIAKEDLDERTEGTPPSLLQNMKVPKHYPEFRYILTDDEGRILVLSWERPPGRKGFYMDIFDLEGRYIVRAVMPVIRPLIRKGRLYAAEETADGYPVLKRYKVTWKF